MNKKGLLTLTLSLGLGLNACSQAEKSEDSATQESLEQEVSEIYHGLEYNDDWIWDEMQNMAQPLLDAGGKPTTTPELFGDQVNFMRMVNNYMVIRGYDKDFMENESTVAVLRTAIRYSIDIYALFPMGLETSLDRIQRGLSEDDIIGKPGKIVIIRTSKPVERGYLLGDDWLVLAWTRIDKPDKVEYSRIRYIGQKENEIFRGQFLEETSREFIFPKLEPRIKSAY